jgi:DNA transformation protein and related proteins
MSVSDGYREWVLEQLGRVRPVTSRRMFGALGVYADGIFFAIVDDDVLYLKVDDVSRPDYEAIGAGPFKPGEQYPAMQYYPPPADALEDPERLRPWVENAIEAARRAKRRKR